MAGRWLWAGVAAVVVVALAGILAVSWWLFGRDTAAAIATIAAVPIAVAVVVVPAALARFRRRAPDPGDQLSLVVSAASDEPAAGLHYESRGAGSRIVIEPHDPYLDLVRQGGELTPVDFWWTPWEHTFEWPALDVKVVNNTDRTLFFHEAVFHVVESRPDLRPVPLIQGIAYGMHLPLINIGWGPMIDPVLRFMLSPGDDAPAVSREVEWHFESPEKAQENGSLASFFGEAGVDLQMLERLRWSGNDGTWYYLPADSGFGEPVPADGSFFAGQRRVKESEYEALKLRALGPFKEHYGVLRGTLEYNQNDLDGTQTRHANRIRAYVSFDDQPAGAPMPPTWTYQVRLQTDGRDYTVSTPISQALKAGDADRFLLRLAADRSSLHDFTLQLLGNEDLAVSSDPISLELFVSTLDAERAQQQHDKDTRTGPKRRQPRRKQGVEA